MRKRFESESQRLANAPDRAAPAAVPPLAVVVDDSLTVRMDLCEAFEADGFRVRDCRDAGELRALLRIEPVRLVLLDVQLPDADGSELSRELRAQFPGQELVIVLLSAESEAPQRVRGLRHGADDYIGKPYDRAFVIARARELLGLPRRAGVDSTILVVEDSPTSREQLRSALEQRGHRVLTAASGEEGLRLATAQRPSALIVDATLPAMDGHTLIRSIRQDEALRGTPCLLLTAQEGEQVELHALDAGADAFVRKAESFDVLLARLSALLRGPRPGRDDLPSLLAQRRLLLVHANAADHEQRVGSLRDHGFDLALARSAGEAIELLALQRIDCVLLEWRQSAFDAAATCRSIKAAPGARDVPVLVLSGDDGGSTLFDALGAGADDVIARSAEADVLLARVRARLRRRQFQEESRQVQEDLLRSERRAAESSAAQQIAEAASRAKSEFLSAMSHELRTPLNAILGFAQLLARDRREPLSERHQQRVQQILDGGKHLLRLIEDILDLSRIEASGIPIAIQPVDVLPVVQEVLANLSPLAAQSSLALQVECQLREVPAIAADPTRFTQILMNLGSNAIKYNRANGKVLFEVSLPRADRLRVRVQDTGVGIPEELQHRLFQPFQRIGQETGPIEGTGIGLVITRELARRMHGDIGFRSVSGVGSEFWVDLPLQGG